MKFNEVLKELRQGRRLTHKQLAESIGSSNSIISEWETGKKQPTLEYLIILAKFFDVSIDYLAGIEK